MEHHLVMVPRSSDVNVIDVLCITTQEQLVHFL